MARGEARRRRRRRRSDELAEEEIEDLDYRPRGRHGRDRRHRPRDGGRPGSQSQAKPAERARSRPAAQERPLTCLQCANLVITRSIVKLIGESWDRATAYPTYSCFEQRWTLENPAGAESLAEVTPYLVDGADECPSYRQGQARDFRTGYDW